MRIGLIDIGAAGLALVVLLLPAPGVPMNPVFDGPAAALAPRIALAQADCWRNPDDGRAVERLVDLLLDAGETDWAMRIAGVAAVRSFPERWRALLALSSVHAFRLEVRPAWDYAQRALAACQEPGAACPDYEQARLETYVAALGSGVDSGIDPRVDIKAFGDAVRRAAPIIRLGSQGKGPPPPPPPPTTAPSP